MSQWTHVCGLIRIDSMWDVRKSLIDSFGKTYKYADSIEAWEACTVPTGSEGSVQYDIVNTRDEKKFALSGGSITFGYVAIHGDLRDYDDANEIYEWIKNACGNEETAGWWVRSCCVRVEIEYGKSFIIYDENDEIFMKEL